MATAPDIASDLDYPIRIERGVFTSPDGEIVAEVARFNQQLATVSRIVERCADERTIAKAMAIRDVANDRFLDSAIYVAAVGGATVAKVGVSTSPTARLSALQNASPHKMRFTHLFWMPHKASFGIEGIVLRVAAKLGKRLQGEWLDFSADDAATIVASVLTSSTVSFSDSAMFCQNVRNAYRTPKSPGSSSSRTSLVSSEIGRIKIGR